MDKFEEAQKAVLEDIRKIQEILTQRKNKEESINAVAYATYMALALTSI